MLTRAQLAAAWANRNVQAGFRVVREKESNQIDDGPGSAYTLINGGRHFESFADHPYGRLPTTKGGKAAGVVQFLPTTWGRLVDRYGFEDFGPENQRLGFVALVEGRGALPDLMAGRLEAFCEKCREEWTSLPGAAEARSTWSIAKAQAVFEQWGGTVAGATQPAAPIEDESTEASDADRERIAEGESMEPSLGDTLVKAAPIAAAVNPIAGLITGLAGTLIQAFQPKLQQRLEKVTGDADTAKALTSTIMDTAKRLTGQDDPVQATAAAAKDPAVLRAIEDAVEDHLEKLLPYLDRVQTMQKDEWDADERSRDAAEARVRAGGYDNAPILTRFGLYGVGAAAVMVGALLGIQIWFDPEHKASGELLTLFITLVTWVMAKVSTLYDNRFGTSHSSDAKTLMLNELARRPKGGKP